MSSITGPSGQAPALLTPSRFTSSPVPERVVLELDDGPREVDYGTRVGDILPSRINGDAVVAGLLGRRPVSLSTPVTWSAQLSPVALGCIEGQRIHRMSQAFLLLEAAERVAPDAELRLMHSLGFGRRVALAPAWRSRVDELAERLEEAMRTIVAEDLELQEYWVGVAEAMAYFQTAGWLDTVDLLSTWRDPLVPVASYGRVRALATGPLLPRTGTIEGYRVIADRGGLLLVYGRKVSERALAALTALEEDAHDDEAIANGPLPQHTAPPESRPSLPPVTREEALAVSRRTVSMTRQQQRWMQTLGIHSVGAFNRACVSGHVSELIRVSEGFHEKRISRVADEIYGRGKSARVVVIAGPSSSGKTTFIKRLSVQLRVLGVDPVPISLDDYYCDRERTPKNARGELDYEALEALRLDLFQSDVARLVAGEQVTTCRYDFKTGVSHPNAGRTLRLANRSVLMLEGIHGLNPGLLDSIASEQVFRVFVCPLAQLPFDRVNWVHASDVRLIRRIVRDRRTRGWSSADNIRRWEDVRLGERKHIFPFQEHADAVLDTSLPYELAVLKVFAERYLLEVPRSDSAWPTAFRLLNLVDRFVAIYPDAVPPTSILREFIGGSVFEY